MTVDEALEVIIASQRFSVEEWTVERSVHKFVEHKNQTWEEMQLMQKAYTPLPHFPQFTLFAPQNLKFRGAKYGALWEMWKWCVFYLSKPLSQRGTSTARCGNRQKIRKIS